MSSFTHIRTKMEQAGVSEAAILSFQRNYEILAAGSSTDITEDYIEAVEKLPELADVSQEGEGFSAELLAQTVVIKLNGGLGTSMGLQKAKSLLEVKEDSTFLDIIVVTVVILQK